MHERGEAFLLTWIQMGDILLYDSFILFIIVG